jgi:hypothetical protein
MGIERSAAMTYKWFTSRFKNRANKLIILLIPDITNLWTTRNYHI